MSVGRDQAERIAALARLRFDVDELTRVTEELNHILEHVEALKSLRGPERAGDLDAATSGAPLEAHGTSTRGPDAEEPDPLMVSLEVLAPDWRHGFFVVPPLPGLHEGDEP